MKEQREPLLRVNISHFPPPFEPHCEGLARGIAPALPLAAGRRCGARGESCGAVRVTPRWPPEPAASGSCRFHGSGLTGQSPRAAAGGRAIGAGTFVCGVCPAPRCRRRRSSPVRRRERKRRLGAGLAGGCGGRKKPPGIICKSHKSRGRAVGEGQGANKHGGRGVSRGPLQGAAAAGGPGHTDTHGRTHGHTRADTAFAAAESGTTPTRRAGPARPPLARGLSAADLSPPPSPPAASSAAPTTFLPTIPRAGRARAALEPPAAAPPPPAPFPPAFRENPAAAAPPSGSAGAGSGCPCGGGSNGRVGAGQRRARPRLNGSAGGCRGGTGRESCHLRGRGIAGHGVCGGQEGGLRSPPARVLGAGALGRGFAC